MYDELIARIRYHIRKADFMGLKEYESTRLLNEAADAIEELQKRKHGKWMGEFDGWEDNYWCSECKSSPLYKEGGLHDQMLSDFCPNCGADMRESEGE